RTARSADKDRRLPGRRLPRRVTDDVDRSPVRVPRAARTRIGDSWEEVTPGGEFRRNLHIRPRRSPFNHRHRVAGCFLALARECYNASASSPRVLMNSPSLRLMVGACVGAMLVGCGLISSDVTNFALNLPDKKFTIDTGRWQVDTNAMNTYLMRPCSASNP